jgi:protein-L-isoaspartate(D-aspartate) O-methyltransferase
MKPEDYLIKLRERMVAEQIESRHLNNPDLLAAMRKVPRHRFVPPKYLDAAYEDRPLQIGENQTISQPYIVALMTNLLHLTGEEIVLEIGTGSGYQAAILAELSKQVYTIERHASLAKRAETTLKDLGILNVQVKQGDGSCGWPEHAPYDGIMVTAAAPKVPDPLLDQLKVGGTLVLPVGGLGVQYLQTWKKTEKGYDYDMVVPVAFVPLRGRYGFEKDWYDR